MAKARGARPPKPSATVKEYRKARASLLRKISRYEQAGFDMWFMRDGAIPEIPEKITRKHIREMRDLSEQLTRLRRMGKLPKQEEPEPEPEKPLDGDQYLVKVFEGIILNALTYVGEKSPDTERVRARAQHAASLAQMHQLATNLAIRITANKNLFYTWPLLIQRLERYLYDSDQHGWLGDIEEIISIFIELVSPKNEDIVIDKRFAETLAITFFQESDLDHNPMIGSWHELMNFDIEDWNEFV